VPQRACRTPVMSRPAVREAWQDDPERYRELGLEFEG
jgi:hypothetical protein